MPGDRAPGDTSAIDNLYVAFSHQLRPTSVDYCTHCWTEEDEAALLRHGPLREMPAEQLHSYAADVLLTVGGVDDFRYFLPRILHIALGDRSGWLDLEAVACRLRFAGWQTWPDHERDAIGNVWRAAWARALVRFPSAPDPDTVLCAIGNTGADLTPYLATWETTLSHLAGASHLLDYLRARAVRSGAGWQLRNPYWSDVDQQAGIVQGWLAGPGLCTAVAAAVDRADTEPARQVLLEILTVI